MVSKTPLIAIVGSDGSGKSTVGAALLAWLRTRQPAELSHLGKQSGNLGRLISRAPLIGGKLERAIDRQVDAAGELRGVGIIAALTIYAFFLRRQYRFRRMLRHRERGMTILADRFPQISKPSAVDGPGFGRVVVRSKLSRWLARRERRCFHWMTSHRPDLVLRLNVDVATAAERKPDHRPAALARKIADVGALTFRGAPIVDIDATQPLEQVIAQAKVAIAAILPPA